MQCAWCTAPCGGTLHTRLTELLGSGSALKTEVTDAASVGAVVQSNEWLRPAQAEDHTVAPRLLSDRRDNLIAGRTSPFNRLHALLRDLHPGGAKRDLSTLAGGGAVPPEPGLFCGSERAGGCC